MPIELSHGRAVVLIRQNAFERADLNRQAIDERYNLTDEEFRVEDGLIAVGPLPSDDLLPELVEDLEASGLVYFDDFFELSGNWPDWLSLYARREKTNPASCHSTRRSHRSRPARWPPDLQRAPEVDRPRAAARLQSARPRRGIL